MRLHAIATALILASPAILSAQRGRGGALPRSNDGPYGALSYRFIGPPGNRTIAVAGIDALVRTELATFNELLRRRGLPPIVVAQP
jgi:hypothetical protein